MSENGKIRLREANETVSPETSHLRQLSAPCAVKSASPTKTGENSHQARIYALLDEDRTCKPAELQRLIGIPKATVRRLVERYHGDHPRNEAATPDEMENAS